MCVIAIGTVQNFTIDIIESMYANNPDGCGYAYHNRSYVQIVRGFHNPMAMHDSMQSLDYKTRIMAHFRIATVGDVAIYNTQPLSITTHDIAHNHSKIMAHDAITHNGTIDKHNHGINGLSDSMVIAKILASQPHHMWGTIVNQFTGSKFAIMYHDGTITTHGKFYSHDKLLVSNLYWIASKKHNYDYGASQKLCILCNRLYDGWRVLDGVCDACYYAIMHDCDIPESSQPHHNNDPIYCSVCDIQLWRDDKYHLYTSDDYGDDFILCDYCHNRGYKPSNYDGYTVIDSIY